MKICDRIYIVGSGYSGFSISNEYDCTVYLVDCGIVESRRQLILIDAGMGIDTERILDNIRHEGFDPEDIRAVLLTHGHGDHSGGAYELKTATGAEIFALSPTDAYITAGDVQAISLDGAIRTGMFSDDYRYQACPVTKLSDNQTLHIGDLIFTVLRTEGHCIGHAAYLMELNGKKIVFSGDSLFAQGKISIQAIWDCNLQAYMETCKLLDALHIDVLLPAHGPFALNEGYRHIKAATDRIADLAVPDNM